MRSNRLTIEDAKERLNYAINLSNCIGTPLDEKIALFAEHDKLGKSYRDMAIHGLKGADVSGYLFTFRNNALDKIYHWRRWIREYEDELAEGEAKGKAEKARETAVSMLSDGMSVETISK